MYLMRMLLTSLIQTKSPAQHQPDPIRARAGARARADVEGYKSAH